jgi:hypothetical protein
MFYAVKAMALLVILTVINQVMTWLLMYTKQMLKE